MIKKFFFYIFFFKSFSKNKNKYKNIFFQDGIPTNNSTNLLFGFLKENNRIFHFGKIKKIKSDCLIDLKEIQKKFFFFKEDEYFHPIDIHILLLFINLQTNIPHKILFSFNKNGSCNFFLKKENIKIYFIKKIIINGNFFLKKKEILKSIKNVCKELDWWEKIKFIFFGKSTSIVYKSQEMIVNLIEELGKKNFLNLSTNFFFSCIKNTNNAYLYINIDEIEKFIIGSIKISDSLKNKVPLIFIEYFFQENGLNLEELKNYIKNKFKTYVEISIFTENIFYHITINENKNKYNIYIDNIFYQNIKYYDFKTESSIYIGDALNLEKLEKYCSFLSYIYNKKFSYTIHANENSKTVFIQIKKEIEKNKITEILGTEDNQFIVKYDFIFLFSNPAWQMQIIPKIPISSTLKGKLEFILSFKSEKTKFDVFNLNTIFSKDSWNRIKKINNFLSILSVPQSFKFKFLEFNKIYFNQYLKICLFSIYKYFHSEMREELKEYKYYFSSLKYSKYNLFWFCGSLSRYFFSINNNLFFNDFNLKSIFSTGVFIPFKDTKFSVKIYLKTIFNNINIKKNNNMYKHLKTINDKDRILPFLYKFEKSYYNSYENENEKTYLCSKQIFDSNLIINFLFFLNYEFFSFFIGGNYIYLYIGLFFNNSYDCINNKNYFSYGLSISLVLDSMTILFNFGFNCNNLIKIKSDINLLEPEYAFNII